MPKSKGKRGKGKNKSYNSWREDVPENIPIMDSSVSSEEDDHYEIPNVQTKQKTTPPKPTSHTTMNKDYYDQPANEPDGQDWPDDISDSNLLLIRETESGMLEF